MCTMVDKPDLALVGGQAKTRGGMLHGTTVIIS